MQSVLDEATDPWEVKVEWVEVSADREDKVRRRTTRSRMSLETNDSFLIGLYTGAWGIV